MLVLATLKIPLWIILIPLLFILMYGVSLCKNGEWHEDSLSLSHSKDLLGYFALMIVVHHTVQYLIQTRELNVGIMAIFENLGVCFVGMFFFFSGYGLITSLKAKPNYLEGFFKKRLTKIVIPFYVVNTFFVIFLNGMKMLDRSEIPACIVGIVMANDHMWYLVEIALLYILFYNNFKKSKSEEEAFVKMLIQILVIINVSLLLGHGPFWFQGEWWYNSTLLFFIGMVIARFREPVISFAKRNYTRLLVLTGASFLGLYKLTVEIIEEGGYWTEYADISLLESNLDKFQTLFVQVAMIICFVLFTSLLGLKVKVKNKILEFLGKISLELYITHRLCIWVFEKIKSPFLYMLAILVCSLVVATIFYVLLQGVFKVIPIAKHIIIWLIKKLAVVFDKVSSVIGKVVKIKKYSTWGYIFIAPFLLFYMMFSLIPLVSTIVNSFFENYYSGLKRVGPTFVGFANYQKLLANGDFWQYFGNTMLLWILCFIPQIIISLLLAFWFSDKTLNLKGDRFYKTVIYMPGVIMATTMASLFASLFSTVGPINDLMVDTLKIWPQRVSFFSGIATTRGLIIFMNFLMCFGSSTLLLMAGMMNIDLSLFEAAKVDGAGSGVVFRKITMPLIRPIFIYVVITSLISGMQLYDVPAILTGGSGDPVRSSFTMVMYLNNNLYSKNYGISGAISTLMFLVTAALSLVVFSINRKSSGVMSSEEK